MDAAGHARPGLPSPQDPGRRRLRQEEAAGPLGAHEERPARAAGAPELGAEEPATPSEPSGEHAASGDRGRHDGLAREARGLKEQANTLRNLIAEVCSGEEARDLAYRFTRAAESAALRIEGFLEALSPPNRDSRAAIRELARVALHLTHCIELLQQLLECDPELRESTELDQVLGKLAWLRVESLRLQSGLGDDS